MPEVIDHIVHMYASGLMVFFFFHNRRLPMRLASARLCLISIELSIYLQTEQNKCISLYGKLEAQYYLIH
jgi:hypothetical protein